MSKIVIITKLPLSLCHILHFYLVSGYVCGWVCFPVSLSVCMCACECVDILGGGVLYCEALCIAFLKSERCNTNKVGFDLNNKHSV